MLRSIIHGNPFSRGLESEVFKGCSPSCFGPAHTIENPLLTPMRVRWLRMSLKYSETIAAQSPETFALHSLISPKGWSYPEPKIVKPENATSSLRCNCNQNGNKHVKPRLNHTLYFLSAGRRHAHSTFMRWPFPLVHAGLTARADGLRVYLGRG